MKDFLKSLLDNASSLLGYQRGTAQSNFVPDARTDIDRALKASCEDLISLVATRATSPLRTFLDKCTAYIAKSAASSSLAKTDLSAQEFATSEKVKEVHEQFKSVCTTEVEEWKKELRMYLLDEDTVAVLVPPAYVSCYTRRGRGSQDIADTHDFFRTRLLMAIGNSTILSEPSTILSLRQGL